MVSAAAPVSARGFRSFADAGKLTRRLEQICGAAVLKGIRQATSKT